MGLSSTKKVAARRKPRVSSSGSKKARVRSVTKSQKRTLVVASLLTAPKPLAKRAKVVSAFRTASICPLYKVLVGCALSLLCLCAAQESVEVSQADIIILIQSAQDEILLMSDDFLNGDIALALAQTAHFNGVETFVLLHTDSLENEAGYGPYLSMYAAFRVTPGTLTDLLVVDGTNVVKGPLVSRTGTVFDEGVTLAYKGGKDEVNTFRRAWAQGYPFEVDVAFLQKIMEEQ